MLLDSFTLTQQPRSLYYFPEESLQSLVGQSAQGTWTLEVRDARGLYAGTNVSWQMQFVFETNTPTPISLVNNEPKTNSIPPCTIAYYTVDVPSWASFATNILVSASAPVQVWFNQNTPPGFDGTNAGDVLLLSGINDTNTLAPPPRRRCWPAHATIWECNHPVRPRTTPTWSCGWILTRRSSRSPT